MSVLHMMTIHPNSGKSVGFLNAYRQDDVVDEYPGGHKVPDHYRWLEACEYLEALGRSHSSCPLCLRAD